MAFLLVAVTAACGVRVWQPEVHDPRAPMELRQSKESPFVKVHMQSGDLYVLSQWNLDHVSTGILEGNGSLFDQDREPLGQGAYRITVDSIALLESNRAAYVSHFAMSGLMLWTTATGLITGVCVADPKSCFGSCPTFYVGGQDQRPVAEGFSSSFARVLEERDVDLIRSQGQAGDTVVITMRNEAYETHAVRSVHLRAVPRPEGWQVATTQDARHFLVRDLRAPTGCNSDAGSCTDIVKALDDLEYSSTTDPTDLGMRESVELTLPATDGPVGLILGARHSLVSTFLFYQAIAYAGTRGGLWLAELERGDPDVIDRALGLSRALGPIVVAVAEGEGPFREVGTFTEAGPIATDVQLLPFQSYGSGPIRVRLSMAKGAWRIDYVALAELGMAVAAERLEPDVVVRDASHDDRAMALLHDRDAYLVTAPGDTYHLRFTLPPLGGPFELFLETRGYYYEWTREEWLGEEDPRMLALVLADPHRALRAMARAFKEVEGEMDAKFWASRFRRN